MSLMLSGCTSAKMNTQFSCGVGKGLGCKSVSEVNHIIDEKTKSPNMAEQKLKIWFAPHVDEHGNDVEDWVMYTLVKDIDWKSE